MKEGITLLLGNLPAMFLAGLSAMLIKSGYSAWTWAWFLALAAAISITPKGGE